MHVLYTLGGMDSLARTAASTPGPPAHLPAWVLPRGRMLSEAAAAFVAGIELKSLDDLVRSEPVWTGCWRARQALKCTAVAVRLMARNEEAVALRDAALLTDTGNDPGPAGISVYVPAAWSRTANTSVH